jgi:hypothetical protein
MRGSYGKVFDGESFKVEHMDTVCNKIIDTVADMICNGTLNIPEFADYDKKLEKLDKKQSEEDPKWMQLTRMNIKTHLYNNKEKMKRDAEPTAAITQNA